MLPSHLAPSPPPLQISTVQAGVAGVVCLGLPIDAHTDACAGLVLACLCCVV